MNISYKTYNTFINRNPYDFKINFPLLWREVDEAKIDKSQHTIIQYARLFDANDENKQVLLPKKMWTNSGSPRHQEGEEIQYFWDYNESWDLNNISYLNK